MRKIKQINKFFFTKIHCTRYNSKVGNQSSKRQKGLYDSPLNFQFLKRVLDFLSFTKLSCA